MSMIQALILGLLQGVTSLLPISSSGHLVFVGNLMGISSDISLKFLTIMHIGTLIAVVSFFYADIIHLVIAAGEMIRDAFYDLVELIRNIRHPEEGTYRRIVSTNYRKFALMLLISMLPTMLVGRILKGISELAAGNLLLCAMGFFVTALVLVVSSFSENTGRKPSNTRVRDALVIGTFQGISAIPGVSRLGMVISGASMAGFGRKYMIEYAMISSIPTIVGGLVTEAGQSSVSILTSVGAGSCVVGVIAAAAAGYFMIRISARMLSRSMNRGFAVYCIIIGILLTVCYSI